MFLFILFLIQFVSILAAVLFLKKIWDKETAAKGHDRLQ